MLKLCRVDIERSDQIFEGIKKYTEVIIQKLKPKRIILFGSFARGDINEASDVDLIVVSNWKETFLDRIKVLLDLNAFGIPLEPLGYTEDEFQKLLENKNRFLQRVMEEGIVLYER